MRETFLSRKGVIRWQKMFREDWESAEHKIHPGESSALITEENINEITNK